MSEIDLLDRKIKLMVIRQRIVELMQSGIKEITVREILYLLNDIVKKGGGE